MIKYSLSKSSPNVDKHDTPNLSIRGVVRKTASAVAYLIL